MTITITTKRAIADKDCDLLINKLFGTRFTMSVEPHVFNEARSLSNDYGSGTWDYFALSNGGFLMSPRSGTSFNVGCASGEQVKISPEGLGIAACLCAYSHLSFGSEAIAETCGHHYYLLHAFMLEHLEAQAILRAID